MSKENLKFDYKSFWLILDIIMYLILIPFFILAVPTQFIYNFLDAKLPKKAVPQEMIDACQATGDE